MSPATALPERCTAKAVLIGRHLDLRRIDPVGPAPESVRSAGRAVHRHPDPHRDLPDPLMNDSVVAMRSAERPPGDRVTVPVGLARIDDALGCLGNPTPTPMPRGASPTPHATTRHSPEAP